MAQWTWADLDENFGTRLTLEIIWFSSGYFLLYIGNIWTDLLMLESHPRDSDLIDLDCGLGTGRLKKFLYWSAVKFKNHSYISSFCG